MAVPLTAAGIEQFTPESLRNLAVPPVFEMRTAHHRRWIAFQDALMDFPGLDRPLINHDNSALRAEILVGLDTLYTGEAVAAERARLQETFQILEQEQQPDDAAIEHMMALTNKITNEWKPLRQMAADNVRFYRDAPRIALAMLVAGWTGIDLPYYREGGFVPLDVIDELALKIGEIEQDAIARKVDGIGMPGTAFVQLTTEAFSRLRLTDDERKNSSSPSPSSAGQELSTTTPAAKTAGGASKASASSKRRTTRRAE